MNRPDAAPARRPAPLLVAAAALAGALALGASAQAQIPDRFTNLEVLPKEISKADLVSTMKSFTRALGVRCEHCHATKPGVDPAAADLEDLDFASDAREAKQRAREMVRMVRSINDDHLAKLTGGAMIRVQCVTCHRGVVEPETIDDRMARLLDEESAEAAIADYRELRAEYLESGVYNFDERPLNALAEKLLAAGKADDALAFLTLNVELHPDSARAHLFRGEAHLARGERDAARAAFERSLELEPENPLARKRLAELAADAPAPAPPESPPASPAPPPPSSGSATAKE